MGFGAVVLLLVGLAAAPADAAGRRYYHRDRYSINAPTASIEVAPVFPIVGQATAFIATSTASVATPPDDSDSSDPIEGHVVSYEWDFGDGHTATGPKVSHTYSASATKVIISLKVTDVRIQGADKITTVLVITRVLTIVAAPIEVLEPRRPPWRFTIRITPFTGHFVVIDE